MAMRSILSEQRLPLVYFVISWNGIKITDSSSNNNWVKIYFRSRNRSTQTKFDFTLRFQLKSFRKGFTRIKTRLNYELSRWNIQMEVRKSNGLSARRLWHCLRKLAKSLTSESRALISCKLILIWNYYF